MTAGRVARVGVLACLGRASDERLTKQQPSSLLRTDSQKDN